MSMRSLKSNDGQEKQLFGEVGTYHGITVAIIRVRKDAVTFTREDLWELNTVRNQYFTLRDSHMSIKAHLADRLIVCSG